MTRVPDFRELVGDDLNPEERERLRRAHDLLVDAGPPPELTPALEAPPATGASIAWLPQRRLGAAAVLAAALMIATFAVGFLLGDRSSDPGATVFEPVRTVVLGEPGKAVAVVRLGKSNEHGNHPMLVTVEGLEHQSGGDYYSLFMVKDGEPVALCGTFNVAGKQATTIRLNTAYGFEGYDGLLLAEYRESDHKDVPLLQTRL